MEPRFIFTADDFGPVDFINDGIFEAVRLNIINSVHVLVNGDTKESLLHKLQKLNACVNKNRTLDIGIHFTLTSGGPLSGETNSEKKQIWKKMVYEKNGTCYFHNQHSFYYDFFEDVNSTLYEKAILRELKMQRDLLDSIIQKIQSDSADCRLIFTCASSHHNLLASNKQLFEIYLSLVGGLSVRSPKHYPSKKTGRYLDFFNPVFYVGKKGDYLKNKKQLNNLFLNNLYWDQKSIHLKSPTYTDFELYCSLSSFGILKWFRKRNMDRKMDRFYSMCQRAIHYQTIPPRESEHFKLVEFVFHLGSTTEKLRVVKNRSRNYPGIETGYFEDRLAELSALQQVSSDSFINYLFSETSSWTECQPVYFGERQNQ